MNVDLNKIVSEKLSESKDEVKNRVVNHLYENKIKNRVEQVLNTLEKIETAKKELKKVKPDTVSYDIEGKEINSGYTKENLDKINKQKFELIKLEEALEKALSKNDFSNLN